WRSPRRRTGWSHRRRPGWSRGPPAIGYRSFLSPGCRASEPRATLGGNGFIILRPASSRFGGSVTKSFRASGLKRKGRPGLPAAAPVADRLGRSVAVVDPDQEGPAVLLVVDHPARIVVL